MALLKKLKNRLGRTRDNLVGNLLQTLRGQSVLNDELWEQMEEILIRGDVGVETSLKLLQEVKQRLRGLTRPDPGKVLEIMQGCVLQMLQNGFGIPGIDDSGFKGSII